MEVFSKLASEATNLGYLNITFIIIAVASFGFAVYSHRVNRDFKKLTYAVESGLIFHLPAFRFSEEIKLKVGDAEYRAAHYFFILVENRGTRAIERSDLAGGQVNVRFNVTGGQQGEAKLISIELLSSDQGPQAISVEKDGNKAKISFDHIPPKSGFLLRGIATESSKRIVLEANLKSFGPARKTLFWPFFFWTGGVGLVGLAGVIWSFRNLVSSDGVLAVVWLLIALGIMGGMTFLISQTARIADRLFAPSKALYFRYVLRMAGYNVQVGSE